VATASLMNATRLDSSFFGNDRLQMIFEMTSRLTDLSPDQFKAITQMFGGESSPTGRSLRKLRGVPLMLIQQMADPYLVGQKLWFQRFRQKGSDDSEQWLRNPPKGTAEIFYDVELRDRSGLSETFQGPTYQNSLGVYVILRWLEVFRERPSWGGQIEFDQVFLLQAQQDTDSALVWEIQFKNEESLRNFGAELSRGLEPQKSPSRGHLFRRESGERYLWTAVRGKNMVMIVDDDPDPRDELSTAPRMREAVAGEIDFYEENKTE